MKTAILLTIVLFFPVVGFSQAVLDQGGVSVMVDGDSVTVAPDRPLDGAKTTPGSSNRATVDIVGDTSNQSIPKTGLAKGNSYRIDTSVTLIEAEFWLDFRTTQTLRFYVFESPVEFGTYTKIFETSATVTGTGAGWYSSGPISVVMNAGNHYIIAVSWDGTLVYFFDTGDTQATSFGAYVHGYATGTDPLPATISSTVNDQAIYHQRLTSEKLSLTVDNNQISATSGGTSKLFLDAGTANANRNYLIFGGVSGTAPGTPLPGGLVVLPINWDVFTNIVIQYANTPIFDNFLGGLDASGKSEAKFNMPPAPAAAGIIVYFAFALNNPWNYVSNPVLVFIV